MNWTDRDLAETIITYTAAAHDLSPDDITGHARDTATVAARQVAMHLMRRLTDLSYPQIGHLLGGRHHSTVIHGCRRVAERLRTRPRLRTHVAAITATIEAASAPTAVAM